MVFPEGKCYNATWSSRALRRRKKLLAQVCSSSPFPLTTGLRERHGAAASAHRLEHRQQVPTAHSELRTEFRVPQSRADLCKWVVGTTATPCSSLTSAEASWNLVQRKVKCYRNPSLCPHSSSRWCVMGRSLHSGRSKQLSRQTLTQMWILLPVSHWAVLLLCILGKNAVSKFLYSFSKAKDW